jgi:uncharacterized protein YdgA (DUF945 family)
MLRLNKQLITIFTLVGIFIVTAPLFVGIWIQYRYNDILASYNASGNVHLEVVTYQRHWFKTEVTLAVELTHPALHKLTQIIHQGRHALHDARFILQQHIDHGPYIYRAGRQNGFNLAFIQSRIKAAGEIAQIVSPLKENDDILEMQDCLSFTGKMTRRLSIPQLNLDLIQGVVRVTFSGAQGEIILWLQQPQMQINAKLDNIKIITQGLIISMPSVSWVYDGDKAESGLWVGKNIVNIAEVDMVDASSNAITLLDLRLADNSLEKDNLLKIEKEITLEKFISGNAKIGPIDINLSLAGMRAKAVFDLTTTLHNLLRSDDVAVSDLRDQFFTFMPKIITPDSDINLKKLKINTADGNVELQGQVVWPNLKASADMPSLLKASQLTANIKLPISMADSLVENMAGWTMSRHVPNNNVHVKIDKEREWIIAKQKNMLLIAMLIQQQRLPKQAGVKLIGMLKSSDNLNAYLALLNKLAQDKVISDNTQEYLLSEYDVMKLASLPDEQKYDEIKAQLEHRLQKWLVQGYIRKDGLNYQSDIDYKEGKIWLNGKEF